MQFQSERSPLRTDKMDPAYDTETIEEESPRRIPTKFTVGRVINLFIAFLFLLIVITALTSVGSLGSLNMTLRRSYPDDVNKTTPLPYQVCILYSSCDDDPTGTAKCLFHYGQGGSCSFAEATLGIISAIALIYIVVSIVRFVLATDIWLTVIVDNLVIFGSGFFTFIIGITVSVGLAITCREVKQTQESCDSPVPEHETGFKFYHLVNVSQATAWLCFMFLVVVQGVFIARAIVFFTRCRKSSSSNMDDSEILTAEDHIEEESPKPI